MSHYANAPGYLLDGNTAFHGGADASVPPSDIARNQVASAINCTMRRGPIGPRPGWKPRPLTFADEDTETAFKTGRFQHGSFYASETSPSLISSHAGRLFIIQLENFTVQEITPTNPDTTLDRNNALLDIGWSAQPGSYWVYQDNQSKPIIFNGSGCRRSRLEDMEVPVGNVMAYINARLVVALPNRHDYRVGDLLFSTASGTAAAGYRDSVLKFTENSFLSEGGDLTARVFGAPSNDGIITAMKAIAQTDTQLGQGPGMIGTPYNVFTVRLPFDRTVWKDMANPLQTNSPLMGPVAQDSMVLVNGDIWYRSIDGIRSYMMAQRQFRSWMNTPMSEEIGNILSQDTEELLEHGSGVLFDNRLLMTISPAPSPMGVYHRGLAVLDFHMVSNMRQELNPAWEGIWKGLQILKIVKGMVGRIERCFAWVLNCDNEIEIWELSKSDKFDGTATPIIWGFAGPSYNFNNSDQLKRLETARIILNNLTGTLTSTVTYRTDQNPCYSPWDNFTVCSKIEDCCYDLTTTVEADFTMPTVGLTVDVTVASSVGMSLSKPTITIGNYTFLLTVIVSDTVVTLQNTAASQTGLVRVGTVVEFCGFDCNGPHTYVPQERTPVRLHAPPDTADEESGTFKNRGYEFQPYFSNNGYALIRQIRLFAKDAPDTLGVEKREII